MNQSKVPIDEGALKRAVDAELDAEVLRAQQAIANRIPSAKEIFLESAQGRTGRGNRRPWEQGLLAERLAGGRAPLQ